MKPSATAAFVGPSRCLSCHTGHANQLQTLHANGLKTIGAAAPRRFPNWFEARSNSASAVADPNGEAAFSGAVPETLNVTCETCHGPGSEHVAGGKATVSVSLLTPEREVTICAQCHTRFDGRNLGTVAGNDYGAAKSEAGLAAWMDGIRCTELPRVLTQAGLVMTRRNT